MEISEIVKKPGFRVLRAQDDLGQIKPDETMATQSVITVGMPGSHAASRTLVQFL
jgi:hypothetical protein